MIAEKPVIRRSLAESLITCPAFVREDGEQLAFGQAWHSFAATYILQCKATHEETRQTDVARLAAEAWIRTPGLLHSRLQEFIRLCERFAESHFANLETLTVVEHTETLDVGDMILTGTMDRIDRADLGDPDDDPEREIITDYKTERSELDHEFQLRTYAQLRLLNHPSLKEVGFIVDFVRDGWSTEAVWFRRGELDGWWDLMLASLRERLALRDPQPVGGPACDGCGKRGTCPKALTIAREKPDNEDQADELFEETLRLEQALEVRRAGLKDFYRDREHRVAHGHEVGFLTPREPRLHVVGKPLEVLKWLNRRHYDGEAMLKVDTEAVAPVGEKLVEAGLATREYSKPGFRWRKHVPAREERRKRKKEEETNASD